MVWVEGTTMGAKAPAFAPFGFEPDERQQGGEAYRVRHLIAKLVRESVRDFRLRENRDAFRSITPAEIAKGLESGRFGRPRDEAQHVDIDLVTAQAHQAFEDGLYLLFVDEEEKKSLEDFVHLAPETRVRIIRLTALAGY